MAKYRSYERNEMKRSEGVHPIWRGIGCIILIVIPIMAFLGSLLIIQQGQANKWPLPPEIMGRVQLPAWLYNYAITRQFAQPVASVDNLYAILLFTIVMTLLAFGVLAVIYAWTYKAVGPSRYTPLDAPEVEREAKRRRR
jgi:hypothetical protein